MTQFLIYATVGICLYLAKRECEKLEEEVGHKVVWARQLIYATGGAFIASVFFKPFW